MKPIHFKEVNIVLAENQPEYLPLPVQLNNDVPGMPAWCKYELSDAEIAIIIKTKSFYLQQLTFQEPLPVEDQPGVTMGYHPIYPCVENPWKQLPIEWVKTDLGTLFGYVPLQDGTFKEIAGINFVNLIDEICEKFPELQPENLNFVAKRVASIDENGGLVL